MKKFILYCTVCFSFIPALWAQSDNTVIRNANKLYRQTAFDKALPEYQKALSLNPNNPAFSYNLGNVQFRTGKWEDAARSFDNAISKTSDAALKQKSFYNRGVAFTKNQKLEESIDSYKNSLKLNPNDEDARHNLQKALIELKKKNPEEKKENKKQDQKKKQKDKPQQNKLNKKQVEQLLKALQQKEQEVQKKMLENRSRSVTQPDKDW